MQYWKWTPLLDTVLIDFFSLSAWNTSVIIYWPPDRHMSFQFPLLHRTERFVLPAKCPAFHGINGSVLPGLPVPVPETAPGRSSPLPDALFFDIQLYKTYCFFFPHDVNTTRIRLWKLPQPHISDINDTLFFDFLSFFLFVSAVFVLDSPAATPYLWQGTLQADASLHIARRFSESLADYNLESILFLVGRNSYHYPPQMILAKDLRKSIHSYKDSLRMRTGTDSFLTK